MRKLEDGELIERGDYYIDDNGKRHDMDKTGCILVVRVIGKTVEKAVVLVRNNAPGLSRFLPEGWEWVLGCEYPYVRDESGADRLCPAWYEGHWHAYGLLHPGEGGGFQLLGGCADIPLPNDVRVDTINARDEIWPGAASGGINCQVLGVKGFRPHCKKGSES